MRKIEKIETLDEEHKRLTEEKFQKIMNITSLNNRDEEFALLGKITLYDLKNLVRTIESQKQEIEGYFDGNTNLNYKLSISNKEVDRLNELLKTQNEEQIEILADKALKYQENTKLKKEWTSAIAQSCVKSDEIIKLKIIIKEMEGDASFCECNPDVGCWKMGDGRKYCTVCTLQRNLNK